jgi:hypothetical protein
MLDLVVSERRWKRTNLAAIKRMTETIVYTASSQERPRSVCIYIYVPVRSTRYGSLTGQHAHISDRAKDRSTTLAVRDRRASRWSEQLGQWNDSFAVYSIVMPVASGQLEGLVRLDRC